MKDYITIIGGGLAGCEAAYQIAKAGIKVKLYEMKPIKYSEAHSNENLAEIVCSNSFKSNLLTNACGLLKEELRRLDSLLIRIADETQVPAGQALAVDREKFAQRVTQEIEANPLIEIIHKEVENVESYDEIDVNDGIVIIATGPLTSEKMAKQISKLTGEDKLYFYDAAAPIISKDSINFDIAFYGNRYEQEKKKNESIEEWKEKQQNQEKSYINLPMNKEEYEAFWQALVEAEVVTLHDFEKREIFEGCMPIEIMAKRGIDTLRFGPLKPVGFTDPRTGYRPYAIVQLRQDNTDLRLTEIGHEVGLISEKRYQAFLIKKKQIEEEIERLENTIVKPTEKVNELLKNNNSSPLTTGVKMSELLRRTEMNYEMLGEIDENRKELPKDVTEEVEIEVKYKGYIKLQQAQVEKFKKLENKLLPKEIDYSEIKGLRLEARQKLNKIKPNSVGQASRISGVSPADISVLLIYLEQIKK